MKQTNNHHHLRLIPPSKLYEEKEKWLQDQLKRWVKHLLDRVIASLFSFTCFIHIYILYTSPVCGIICEIRIDFFVTFCGNVDISDLLINTLKREDNTEASTRKHNNYVSTLDTGFSPSSLSPTPHGDEQLHVDTGYTSTCVILVCGKHAEQKDRARKDLFYKKKKKM